MKKVVILMLALIMCVAVLAGCGEKGPDVTGKYLVTSSTSYGETTEGNGEWIELKNGGKASYYSGDNYDGSEGITFEMEWKLDGENFTGKVTLMGMSNDCNGTLKDGVLSVTYGDFEYVMTKEGVAAPKVDAPATDNTNPAESTEPEASTDPVSTASSIVGTYSLSGLVMEGVEYSSEELVDLELTNAYVMFNEDNTGELTLDNDTKDAFVYDEAAKTMTLEDGSVYTYTIDNDSIAVVVPEEDMTLTYTRE